MTFCAPSGMALKKMQMKKLFRVAFAYQKKMLKLYTLADHFPVHLLALHLPFRSFIVAFATIPIRLVFLRIGNKLALLSGVCDQDGVG